MIFFFPIKMDFDKSLNSKCSFCGSCIKLTPVECIGQKYKFCDIACAKLFYDNVEKIKVNIKEYNMYYSNNQLSVKAKYIYEKMNSTIFSMLPIYKIQIGDNKKEAKKRYAKMIVMMTK